MLHVYWNKIEPPLTDQEKEGWGFATGVALMVLGMRGVTTGADLHEVLVRSEIYKRLHGRSVLTDMAGNDRSTPEHWKRWYSVSINGVDETRSKWVRRMTKSAVDEIEYAVDSALKEQGVA